MAPTIDLMPPIAFSPTLAADEKVARLRAEQRPILHMGFGQAPFPAPPRMVQALTDAANEKAYLPVAGLPALRNAVVQHQGRLLGTDLDAMDVLVAPGSKLILYAAQMAIAGDLLLPVPSWVSYAPQARMLGQRVIPVQTDLTDTGMIITEDRLRRTIQDARAGGLNPTKILLNYPNNPTGLTLPTEVLEGIANVCQHENIIIVSDEIYGRLTFDGGYRSISTMAPDHTIVTTGLSKHLSLGGWRLGVGTIPKCIPGLFEALVGIASETWSCVAAPVQIAAIEAYEGHQDIEDFIAECCHIHQRVTGYVADGLSRAGIPTIRPQGGFYAWPDFDGLRDEMATQGIHSSNDLAGALAERFGLVTLPGTAFGEAETRLTLRLSTCDYDGADALAMLGQRGSRASDDIRAFAPNVVAAVESFAAFVQG